MNDSDDYISIALLNQYSYCAHRCWRMSCAGEFTENHYTIEGTTLHDRVHTMGEINRDETWQVRAIWLKSERFHPAVETSEFTGTQTKPGWCAG